VRFYKRNTNSYKGQQRQRYQSNGPPVPNSVVPSATSCTFPALCPPLFTTLKHGCVNYGEARFHKFRDEIWSDKFNSQDPAPWSRWAQVTRVDAHKYVCSRTRVLYVQPSACRLRPSFRLSYVYRLPAAINALPARVILIRMRIVLLKKDQG